MVSFPWTNSSLITYGLLVWPNLTQDCRLTTGDCRVLLHFDPPGWCPSGALRDSPLCIYNFITPTQCSFGSDSRKLLLIVYTGASCNYFDNTAGTPGSVKGQYATYVQKFICQTILFDLLMGPCQMLPLWTRVDLGAMAMKEYSAFPKAPALLKYHHQIV